jgi:hypothetical protein
MRTVLGGLCFAVLNLLSCASVLAGNTTLYRPTVQPPLFPTSMEQCDEYRKEMDAILKQLHDDHEECLKDAPPDAPTYTADGQKVDGICSKRSCQSLHTQRDELNKERNDNSKECTAAVAAVERRRQQAPRPIEESSWFSGEVKKGIDKAVRAIAERSVATLTAYDLKKIEESCKTGMSPQATKACLAKVHAYAEDMLDNAGSGKVVRKIQEESFEKVKEHQNRMLDAMEHVEAQMDAVGEDRQGGSSKRSGTWDEEDY